MSAQPNERPKNKQVDLITKFRDDYAIALADAQVSADHTKTEGWQRLYSDHRSNTRDIRRGIAKRLRDIATTIEDFGANEETEKSMQECKKDTVELLTACSSFRRQVIEEVIAPVHDCERIAMAFRNEAAREEAATPLVNSGLEELMRVAVAEQKRPRWDEETGVVEIIEANKS